MAKIEKIEKQNTSIKPIYIHFIENGTGDLLNTIYNSKKKTFKEKLLEVVLKGIEYDKKSFLKDIDIQEQDIAYLCTFFNDESNAELDEVELSISYCLNINDLISFVKNSSLISGLKFTGVYINNDKEEKINFEIRNFTEYNEVGFYIQNAWNTIKSYKTEDEVKDLILSLRFQDESNR